MVPVTMMVNQIVLMVRVMVMVVMMMVIMDGDGDGRDDQGCDDGGDGSDDDDDDDEICSHLLTVEAMSQRRKTDCVEMPDTQMPDSTRRCPTCRCSRSGSGPSSCAAALSLRVSGRLEPQVRSGLSVHTRARCGLSIICLTSI